MGRVYVYDLNSATPTVPTATLNDPSPGAGLPDNFGSSLAMSGARLVVGASQDTVGSIRGAGSAYVFDFNSGTPTTPAAILNNPAPLAGDAFGYAVVIFGARVVVGAYLDDGSGATDAGIAYLYDLNSGTPNVPASTLNNPTPAGSDGYGNAVAISVSRVVVGARGDDTGAVKAGSAYVYDISGGSSNAPVSVLNDPGPAINENFGRSIAISGQLMVVGSPYEDGATTDTGAAYVYDLSSGTSTIPIFTLNSPAPELSGFFGIAVSISGTRIVVGSNGVGGGAGRAFVYDLASATPSIPIATLNNPFPAAFDEFGLSVAISGTRVVVGAYLDDSAGVDSGSAFVFDLASATPDAAIATFNNPDPSPSDYFGYSVAISGSRVVVSADLDDAGATDAGSAYVFDLESATPTIPILTLNNPAPEAQDGFARSVAISGTRVIVADPFDKTAGLRVGRAYVYDVTSAMPMVPVATFDNPVPGSGESFADSVTISGTLALVGASFYGTGGANAGTAYLFHLASSNPTVPIASLHAPSTRTGQGFGASCSIDGKVAVIGMTWDNTIASGKGSAFVFGPHPLDQDSDGLLDSWEIARFGTTTSHNALNDSDHDGNCELLELAFGMNPMLAVCLLPSMKEVI